MDNTITSLLDASNFSFGLSLLAVYRVYLELVDFDFNSLPLTKNISQKFGNSYSQGIHKFGLYMSVGYILFHAPELLL